MMKWEEVLNLGENFKMSMSTNVCSNHFALVNVGHQHFI